VVRMGGRKTRQIDRQRIRRRARSTHHCRRIPKIVFGRPELKPARRRPSTNTEIVIDRRLAGRRADDGRRRRLGRRLSQCLDGDRAHSEPSQTRYQFSAGKRVIQILPDQFFHSAPPMSFSYLNRHARPCAGHPRLNLPRRYKDVDGRDKPGHDESRSRITLAGACRLPRWIAVITSRHVSILLSTSCIFCNTSRVFSA
jgi:hypothetical protein